MLQLTNLLSNLALVFSIILLDNKKLKFNLYLFLALIFPKCALVTCYVPRTTLIDMFAHLYDMFKLPNPIAILFSLTLIGKIMSVVYC